MGGLGVLARYAMRCVDQEVCSLCLCSRSSESRRAETISGEGEEGENSRESEERRIKRGNEGKLERRCVSRQSGARYLDSVSCSFEERLSCSSAGQLIS